jgi:four helix bundle protein
MSKSIAKDKSLMFAVEIVNLYKYLSQEKREFVLSKQVLRSGTIVGAMIREAEHAQSKPDFIHKLSIAQKEINETIYWLELLHITNYIVNNIFIKLNDIAIELIKILTTSIKTAKISLDKNKKL